ncbi:hypothetical protein ACHAXA_004174 [Cyclostephanos tholiformis]|uniref:Uncharacterized protein n=1 Tax=Cyclostephanos tholiformis TaxID=382380 RepID=A0ABD3RC14_9STRA
MVDVGGDYYGVSSILLLRQGRRHHRRRRGLRSVIPPHSYPSHISIGQENARPVAVPPTITRSSTHAHAESTKLRLKKDEIGISETHVLSRRRRDRIPIEIGGYQSGYCFGPGGAFEQIIRRP